jgi:hypothetical protein
MDCRDRHEHHTGNRGCTEWSEETESEKRAASELGESDDCGVQASGPEAHGLEPTTGADDAVTTEPPKQLLGPVSCHDRSEHHSYD